jgi:hypothetical protein
MLLEISRKNEMMEFIKDRKAAQGETSNNLFDDKEV